MINVLNYKTHSNANAYCKCELKYEWNKQTKRMWYSAYVAYTVWSFIEFYIMMRKWIKRKEESKKYHKRMRVLINGSHQISILFIICTGKSPPIHIHRCDLMCNSIMLKTKEQSLKRKNTVWDNKGEDEYNFKIRFEI